MKKSGIVLVVILLLMCSLVSCSKFEYNTTILKKGFTFNSEWIENNYTQGSYQSEYNNELPESRIYVIKHQDDVSEVFTEFPQIDFATEMVIVYCYTTTSIREQKLVDVSFENDVLNIEFDVVKGKLGAGDATAPQTRTCVIRLDKVEANKIIITYNGQ